MTHYTKNELDAYLDLFNNKEKAMELILHSPNYFHSLSDKLRDDEEIVSLAISKKPSVFAYASDRLRKKTDLVKKVLEHSPLNFLHIHNELKDNKDFVYPYLIKEPAIYRCLSSKLQNDKEIVLIAVQDIRNLDFINKKFLEELDVIMASSLSDSENVLVIFQYINEKMQNNRQLLEKLEHKMLDYIKQKLPEYELYQPRLDTLNMYREEDKLKQLVQTSENKPILKKF